MRSHFVFDIRLYSLNTIFIRNFRSRWQIYLREVIWKIWEYYKSLFIHPFFFVRPDNVHIILSQRSSKRLKVVSAFQTIANHSCKVLFSPNFLFIPRRLIETEMIKNLHFQPLSRVVDKTKWKKKINTNTQFYLSVNLAVYELRFGHLTTEWNILQ